MQSKVSSHYEVPNLSSSKYITATVLIFCAYIVLYDYTNREKDIVVGAFRTGNHYSLRDLPNLITPFNVCDMLKEKQ